MFGQSAKKLSIAQQCLTAASASSSMYFDLTISRTGSSTTCGVRGWHACALNSAPRHAALLPLMWLALFSPALAQTTPSAGQLTPRSFEAPPVGRPPSFSFHASEAIGTPPGADKTMLNISQVILKDGDSKFAGQTEAILAAVQNQNVPVSAFYEAAAKVQHLYAADGYFLVRVVIPPQNAQNGGVLNLRVIRGFIDSMNIEGLAPQIKQRVAKMLAGLIGRRDLKRAAFDRALLLASETPGLELKTSLAPAATEAGITLTVTGVYRPVSAQVSSDNSLSKSLGVYTSTLSAAANSVLGFGEQLYVSATGAPNNGFMSDSSPRRLAAAGVTLPLGHDGVSSNVEYAWSTTRPITAPGKLATDSKFERLLFKLSYPFLKTESSTIAARMGFDATNESNQATAFKAPLYEDSLRTLRGGLDLNHNFTSGTAVSAGIDLSQGIRGLGSRGAEDATFDRPISQAGASDRFTKLSTRALVRQDLQQGFALEVSGRGQYAATGKLMNSEKFTLGGPSDLSAYDASSFTGDHGWLLRGEIQYNYQPKWLRFTPTLRPYLFAARGQIFTINPTAVEFAVNGADSFGLGVRGALPFSNPVLRQIDLAFEGARQLSDNPMITPHSWRFNFSGSARF